MFSEIEDYCQRYKVEMRYPADIDSFLQQITFIRSQRGKAANLLFADIEADIFDKVSFLNKQSNRID